MGRMHAPGQVYFVSIIISSVRRPECKPGKSERQVGMIAVNSGLTKNRPHSRPHTRVRQNTAPTTPTAPAEKLLQEKPKLTAATQ